MDVIVTVVLLFVLGCVLGMICRLVADWYDDDKDDS